MLKARETRRRMLAWVQHSHAWLEDILEDILDIIHSCPLAFTSARIRDCFPRECQVPLGSSPQMYLQVRGFGTQKIPKFFASY